MATFKYGNEELDSNKLAKYLHDNAKGWAESSQWKDKNAVLTGINEMIGRIESGDIDSLSYSGEMHSNSDFTNNARLKHLFNYTNKEGDRKGIIRTGKTLDTHGIAASFLNDALTAYSKNVEDTKQKEQSTPKEKFDARALIDKNWLNNNFGGYRPSDSDFAIYRKGKSNWDIYGDILKSIEGVANGDYSNYDFSNSNYSGIDDYKSKVGVLRQAYDNQDEDAFKRALLGVGYDTAGLSYIFGTASQPLDSKTSLLQQTLATYRKQLEDSGVHTPEEIERLVQEKEKEEIAKGKRLYMDATAESDFKNYLNNLENTNLWQSDSFGTENLSNRPNGEGSSILDIYNGYNVTEANGDQNVDLFVAGKLISDRGLNEKVRQALKTGDFKSLNDNNAVRAFIWNLIEDYKKGSRDELTLVDGGNRYILNKTVDEKTGTAVVYDTVAKKAFKIKVGPNTPKLKALLRAKWDNKRKASYNKKGGVLKALDGTKLKLLAMERANKVANKEYEAEAKETGRTVDLVKIGRSSALSSNKNLESQGIDVGLGNSDMLRLASLAQDLVSLGASYAGPAGMAASGALGITSLGTDFAADALDETVGWGEAFKNAGVNAGWALLGMIPGANAGKLGKIAKGLMKYAPLAYGVISAAENRDELAKSWSKLPHFLDLTTNDLKNIAYTIKLIVGGHNATKQTAGKLGVKYGAKSSAAKYAGVWGNNAWGKGKDAYYAAMKGQYQRPGAIPLNNDNTVTVGGLKVNPETAKIMLLAARSAARRGSTAELILKAAIDAYNNSAEGKANGVSTKATRFANLKSLHEALRSDVDTEGNYNINGQKLNSQLLKDLEGAYISGYNSLSNAGLAAMAKAGLEAANTKFGLMFDTTGKTPEFDLSHIGGTHRWYQVWKRPFGGNLNAVDNRTGKFAKVKNFISPEREDAVNPNTTLGRNNILYIKSIRDAYGDAQPSFFRNNIEYNLGIKTNYDYMPKKTSKEELASIKARAKADAKLAKIDAKQAKADAKQAKINAKEEDSRIARVASKTARRIATNSKDELDRLGRVARIGELRDKVKQKQESALMSKIARKVAASSKEEYDRQSRVDRIGELRKSVIRSRAKRIASKSKLNESKNKAINLMVNGKLKLNDLKGKFSKNSKTNATNPTSTEAPSILPASGTPTKLGSYKGIGGKKTLNSSALKSLRNTNAKKVADVNNDEALSMEWSKKMGIPESVMKKGKLVTRLYNEIYQDNSGNFYYWKQGGKVPFFQLGTKFPTINWGLYQQPTDWGYQPPQSTNPLVYSNYFVDKDNNGNDIPLPAQVLPNWYAGRWKHNLLNNWNALLDSSKAQQSIAENKWHKFGNDLTAPYLSNKAYTDNSKVVGEDLNSYYNSNYKGKSLTDYVLGYNSDIDNLNQFFDNDLSYSTADSDIVRTHGQSFKAMYPNRSGNTDNDWDLGYSVPNEGQLGTTMWARRGDLYETEFDLLTDELKKSRIHKIGDLGYVYKMANGKIGVVDDDTVSKLGLKGTTTELITADKPSKSKLFLSGLAQGIDPGLAQIPLGLAANKRMLDLALNKRVSLNGYTPVHRQVLGDYSALLNGLSTANSTEALGDRMASNISNSNNAIAARLQANSNANQLRAQANAAFDQGTAKSKEAAWTLEKENSAKLDEVANENRMRLTLKFNADLDVRIAADPYNNIIKPFIMEQSYDYKTNKQDRKLAAINMAKLNIDNYVETKLAPLKNKYIASGALSDYVKYQSALTELKNDPQYKQLMAEYYRANGYDPSKINSVNGRTDHLFVQTGSLAQLKNGGKLMALKKGNKISDDGPVKTRSKDADRFLKTMKSFTDSHDKKVARLANSALLSLKRTMGK